MWMLPSLLTNDLNLDFTTQFLDSLAYTRPKYKYVLQIAINDVHKPCMITKNGPSLNLFQYLIGRKHR